MPDITSDLTIKSLSSRTANKEIRFLLNMNALLITPTPDGRIALSDRTQNFYTIIDNNISIDQLIQIHKLLNTSRMSAEAKFLGEPSDRQFADNLRQARREEDRPPKLSRHRPSMALDLSSE